MDKQHLTNSEHLAKLILNMGIPANDASTALLPHKLTVSGMSRTGLADALGDLFPKITKSTAIADIESHRKAAELILMGTLAAAFDFKNWHSPKSVDKYDVKTEMEKCKCDEQNMP
ncbi:MAG: hypothetical protein P8N60_01335, partial [Burkholderiaceae bacterium]|nr:hypothetical protein [Burkholderiaceae bacterium]